MYTILTEFMLIVNAQFKLCERRYEHRGISCRENKSKRKLLPDPNFFKEIFFSDCKKYNGFLN